LHFALIDANMLYYETMPKDETRKPGPQGSEGDGPSARKLLKYDFDPARNLQAWKDNPMYRDIEPRQDFVQYASAAPLTHGTSIRNVIAVLRAGRVRSYAELVASQDDSIANRMLLQTDELDKEYGLENFSFWDLGRSHTESRTYGGYFIADNSLLDDGLVSFQEIADLGGIVSPEARREYRRAFGLSDQEIDEGNREAAKKYFEGLFEGEDFRDVFARYLTAHHPDISSFLTMWYYHLDSKNRNEMFFNIETGQQGIRSAWQGPQLIVPGGVDLLSVHSLVLADFNGVEITENEETVIRSLAEPYDINVRRLSDIFQNDISSVASGAITRAMRTGPPVSVVHSALNFVLNTAAGAVKNIAQEKHDASSL
jgi:hypothetical protein